MSAPSDPSFFDRFCHAEPSLTFYPRLSLHSLPALSPFPLHTPPFASPSPTYFHPRLTLLSSLLIGRGRAILESITITGLPWNGGIREYSLVLWVRKNEDQAASIAILEPSLCSRECSSGHLKRAATSLAAPIDGLWDELGNAVDSLRGADHRRRASDMVGMASALENAGWLPGQQMEGGGGGEEASMDRAGGDGAAAAQLSTGQLGAGDLNPQKDPVKHEPIYAKEPIKVVNKSALKSMPQGVMFVPCKLCCQQEPSEAQSWCKGLPLKLGQYVTEIPMGSSLEWSGFDPLVLLQGNVKVQLFRNSALGMGRQDSIAYTWFNTAFLPDEGILVLSDAELDKPHIHPLEVRAVRTGIDGGKGRGEIVGFRECLCPLPHCPPLHLTQVAIGFTECNAELLSPNHLRTNSGAQAASLDGRNRAQSQPPSPSATSRVWEAGVSFNRTVASYIARSSFLRSESNMRGGGSAKLDTNISTFEMVGPNTCANGSRSHQEATRSLPSLRTATHPWKLFEGCKPQTPVLSGLGSPEFISRSEHQRGTSIGRWMTWMWEGGHGAL